MRQRFLRRVWYSLRRAGHRPQVLIEDEQSALAISDFVAFHDAGFDVAFCSGPGRVPGACPLLRGEDCDLLAGADVVLHRLDARHGVAGAVRRRHPSLPVVAVQRESQGSAPVPAGCRVVSPACSVNGQLDALREVLDGRGAFTLTK